MYEVVPLVSSFVLESELQLSCPGLHGVYNCLLDQGVVNGKLEGGRGMLKQASDILLPVEDPLLGLLAVIGLMNACSARGIGLHYNLLYMFERRL